MCQPQIIYIRNKGFYRSLLSIQTAAVVDVCQDKETYKATAIITFKGPCIVKYMPIIVQQDATTYSLFLSVNCSTCFGWYLHPSSGVHVTVSRASGTSKTIIATCCEHDWTGTLVQSCSQQVAVMVLLMPDAVVTDINKLYIVASCCTIIGSHHQFTVQCKSASP